MSTDNTEWRPGSFTKNFGWGKPSDGLVRLHEMINVGFENVAEDVPRKLFRSRVAKLDKPDYIALQFFLFNKMVKSEEYVVADELVFQAVNFKHSKDFDKLGLFAFLFSNVGRWKTAKPYQSKPAEWAKSYVQEVVAKELSWNTKNITARGIADYIFSDQRYRAKSANKLSTNLNYLLTQGRLGEFNVSRIEKWWVNCLFLALDRTLQARNIDGKDVSNSRLYEYLITSGFNQLSGPRSIQKDLAMKHVVKLYWACGGLARLSVEQTRQLSELRLPDLAAYASNDPSPVGAVYRGDPSIQKSLPRVCARLAKELANFEILEIDQLENFEIGRFVKDNTREVLTRLQQRGVKPTMTAEELMKLTREK